MKKEEKNKVKKEDKSYFSNKNFWIIFPLILILGIAAGVFGQSLGQYYFSDNILTNYQTDLDLSGLNNYNQGLIIRDPKNVVVNQDVKITETVNSVESSLVGVFLEKEIPELKTIEMASSTDWTNSFAYYNLDQSIFNGLTITSDGWVFSVYQKEIMEDFLEDFSENYLVINNDKEIYRIDDMVVDQNNNLIFFHLKDAKNLAVRKNATKEDTSLGQNLLIVKDLFSVYPTSLTSFKEEGDLSSSEDLDYSLQFNLDTKNLPGAFVFNLGGDLLAFIDSEGEIKPSFSYNYHWRTFLEKTEIARSYLGVNYLDLSRFKFVSDLNPTNKGALLWSLGLEDELAVELNSPAYEAGLKEGDVITWVNNIELDKDNSLTKAIEQFYPGDSIKVIFERDNQENEKTIILGEKK